MAVLKFGRFAQHKPPASTQRTRADAAEAEVARLRAALECHDLWRSQVVAERDAARAEAAGLRADAAVLIAERDHARLMSRCSHGNWRGALGEVDALRAIIEGRTVPPTPQEIDHHWRMGGAWLVGRSVVTDRAEALRLASVGVAGVAWVALDGMLRGGCPCPWPTVAAEAATGAALAGEGW